MKSICIVGGGPAGLAAAIALGQAGFQTTVLESSTPPIDKACGEGLLPDSLIALKQLGIHLPSDCGYAFRGIRFHDEHSTVEAQFANGPALGLRRTVLHSLLVNRSEELGVDLRWGTRHTGQWQCDLTVGADGGRSAVRRQAGLDAGPRDSHRYGFRRHFRIAPWSDHVDVHWSRESQMYVTPVSADEVGVAVVSRNPRLRLTEALRDFPEIHQRLRSAQPLSTERGGLSTMRRLTAVHNERAVLVGDASGSVDVITGEGIGLGFRQALALARCLQLGDLQGYTRAHRAIDRRPRLMANLLLGLSKYPKLRRHALAGLSACPAIFSSLLAFHAREAD